VSGHEDYRVALDVFHGPLDLLLYLVKRDELDLLDIPIARVAEQFRQYLEVLQVVDVERAGEFLVMASTLMELKSRLLLPRPEEANGETGEMEDPRQELVRQLIQYKQFKEAAALLEKQAEAQAARLSRLPLPAPAAPGGPTPVRAVELWDLVSALGRLLRETSSLQSQQILADPTPLHVYMDQVLARLHQAQRVPLSALFTPPHTRPRLVGFFLAILELTRRFQILAEQEGLFGEIYVWLAREPGLGEPGASATEGGTNSSR
jgi:segregation and condensation protein A